MHHSTYLSRRKVQVGLVVSQTKQSITLVKIWLLNSLENSKINNHINSRIYTINNINTIKNWNIIEGNSKRKTLIIVR